MRRSLTFMKDLTNEELGVEIDEISPDIVEQKVTDEVQASTSVNAPPKIPKIKKPKPSPFEAFQVGPLFH